MRGRRVSRRLIAGVCISLGLLHGPVAVAGDAEPAGTSSASAGLRWVARGGERLSELLSTAPPANAALASPYALRWYSRSELQAQQRAKQELIAGLQAIGDRSGADWIGWLAAAPVTGRVRLALQDPQLLQLHPRWDPVLQAGDGVWWPAAAKTSLLQSPRSAAHPAAPAGATDYPSSNAEPLSEPVRVLWADGSACQLPHRSAALAVDYLQACAPQWPRRISKAWIVQPDGEVLTAALDPWADGTRTSPAPGAWIWVPATPRANPLTQGPNPAWPDALAQAMAHWIATQEPGLKAPGVERVLTTAPVATPASQRTPSSLSASDWGGIGLLQTPTARMLSAGHVGFTVSRSQPYTHFNLSVQPFEGVEGVMRYTRVQGRLYGAEIAGDRAYLDKSLEVKLRLWDETVAAPALALGLRDPLGTGLFGGEYLVASKHLGAGAWGQWDASLGLGWGYSGAAQNWANPLARLSSRFATRQESEVGQGGLARVRSWFTGRTALFGGVQWQAPALPLVLKAEWDGNNYQHEPSTDYRFASRSRVNLGLVWHTGPAAFSLAWQRGQALALNFSVQTNISGLRYSANAGTSPTASRWLSAWADEFPVAAPRPNDSTAATATTAAAATESATANTTGLAPTPRPAFPPLQALLTALGETTGWLAQDLREEGSTWVLQAERAGGLLLRERLHAVAELLHAAAPAHILSFEVQATVLGVEVSRHRVDRGLWAASQNQWLPPSARRDAITAIPTPLTPRVSEHAAGPHPQMDAAGLRLQTGAAGPGPGTAALVPQRWLWHVSPGWQQTVGGPDGLLYALSARASSHLPLWRGAWLNGQAALRLADNYGHYQYTAPSGLPRVRTHVREYQTSAAFTVPNVQVNQLIALGSQTHALVYAGLLEPMFAGFGAELLHRPLGANWAVGADWNALRQRDFRQNLSLRDYRVNTGHLSAQWATGWAGVEVFAQAGRYLAGDVGGTLNLSRAFANGSRMGFWATKTRVSAQQFGEGSFDKGVYVSVPFELLLGRPAGGSASVVWQPLIRDGGARLNRAQTLWGLTTLREPMALHYSNPPAPAPWQGSTTP